MKENEVPQDGGVLDGWHEVSYAVDDQGQYVMRPSEGWAPSNLANQQAWTLIKEEVEAAITAVQAGDKSPLAVYMALNQMDEGMLAQYAGVARWRVKRHLKPAIFNTLKPTLLDTYAAVFRISPQQLCRVPDRIDMPESAPIEERNESQ